LASQRTASNLIVLEKIKKLQKRDVMELQEMHGKDIALVVRNMEKEDDVCVFLGRLSNEKDEYFFINQAQSWRVSMNADHIQELRVVPDQLKSILLNAEYFFTMKMGALPDAAHEGFINTNIKWAE
jgi:hypothetical protein